MHISDIEDLTPLIISGGEAIDFKGIACDSRLVSPGCLFAAVSGWKEDGAKYIDSAMKRGAVGVVTDKLLEHSSIPSVQVSDVRRAVAIIAAAVNGNPASEMDIYSITGTNGKTTTAWLLCEMLRSAGRSTGLFTTVSVEYAGREIPALRTTPDACKLQRLLSDMRRDGCDSVVMESSSHALHQSRVAGIPFAGGIFTNLSRDHLDYHRTMDEYFKAKLIMFQQMAELNSGAPAVCCIDSDYGRSMADAVAQLPLTFIAAGFTPGAHLQVSSLKASATGSEFVLNGCGAENLRVQTALAGRYNVQNIACAAALAAASGVAWNIITNVLNSIKPKWGRLERVPFEESKLAAFVDYAHTDDALVNVLSTLREFTKGRLIVVFGCGGDRDRTKRPLMGHACEELADLAVVTSDNPRTEAPEKIIEEILAGVNNPSAFTVSIDRREAIRSALEMAGPDDVILVAGKGHECFQEFGSRSVPFDDRVVLREEAALLKDGR